MNFLSDVKTNVYNVKNVKAKPEGFQSSFINYKLQ